MSNPPDPVRPNDVDSDATLAARDRTVVETPGGFPDPVVEPPARDVTPTEPVDILFPAREDELPAAMPASTAPWPDPAVIAAHFTTPVTAASEPPPPEPIAEVARLALPAVVEEFPEGEDGPIVLPRDDRPWSAWQE